MVLQSLIRLASDISDNEPIVLIDLDTAQWMREICPGINLIPDRNHFEYVYRSVDLADLPGKQYMTIRHHVNKFRKNCIYAVEPITPENHEEVKKFLIQWCEWKGCENEPVLAHEKDATFFAIDHFSELKLSGLIIRVHGQCSSGGSSARLALTPRIAANPARAHGSARPARGPMLRSNPGPLNRPAMPRASACG